MAGSARQFLKDSDVAFIGIPNRDSQGSASVSTPFQVVRNFKGAKRSVINIHSEAGDETGSSCGVSFSKDEGLFLIFAYKERGHLSTSACSVAGLDSDEYSLGLIRELL